jgi:hypothetical protein
MLIQFQKKTINLFENGKNSEFPYAFAHIQLKFNFSRTICWSFWKILLHLYYKKISNYYYLSLHVPQHEMYEKNIHDIRRAESFLLTCNVTINYFVTFFFPYVTLFVTLQFLIFRYVIA